MSNSKIAWNESITTEIGVIAESATGLSGDGACTLSAVHKSGSIALVLDDETVFEWQRRLASISDIYTEPDSAASVAAIEIYDAIESFDTVTVLITGHGFKEPVETDIEPQLAKDAGAV